MSPYHLTGPLHDEIGRLNAGIVEALDSHLMPLATAHWVDGQGPGRGSDNGDHSGESGDEEGQRDEATTKTEVRKVRRWRGGETMA